MKEFRSSVSVKGEITLPIEVRRRLGLKPNDKVALLLEDKGVLIRPVDTDLQSGFRSIPALKTPRTLEEMTEIAAAEHAQEAAGSIEP